MKSLKPHPHVIKLMGCVTEGGNGKRVSVYRVVFSDNYLRRNIIFAGKFKGNKKILNSKLKEAVPTSSDLKIVLDDCKVYDYDAYFDT